MDDDAIIELLIAHGYILSGDRERATILLRKAFAATTDYNGPAIAAQIDTRKPEAPSESAKGEADEQLKPSEGPNRDTGERIAFLRDRLGMRPSIADNDELDALLFAKKAEAELKALAQEIIDYRTWTMPGPRKENARKVFEHALAALNAGKE